MRYTLIKIKSICLITLSLQGTSGLSQNHIDSLFVRIETGKYERKVYLDALFFDKYDPEWSQLFDIEPNMAEILQVGLANQIISEYYSNDRLYTAPNHLEKRIDNNTLTFNSYYHLRNGETIFIRGNMGIDSQELLGFEHAKFATNGITLFQLSCISLNNTKVEIFESPKLCVAYSPETKKWKQQRFEYNDTLFNTIYLGCKVDLSQLSFSQKIVSPNISQEQNLYLSSFGIIGLNNKNNYEVAWIAVNDSKLSGVWLLDEALNFRYHENINKEMLESIIENQEFSNLIKYSTNQF